MIHSSAVISPEAEIADDAVIGPYVCIEGPVKIGAGCRIHAHAVLTGDVVLGPGNLVGEGAVLGAAPQDLSYREGTPSGVRIGAGNIIREHCTIHRGTKEGTCTVVGDRNFLMAGCHVGHNACVGNGVVLANNTLLGGHVEVQDHAFLGGGSVYHQFVRVGRFVITQGLSAFSKDVPPFTMAAGRNTVVGLNTVGLRRGGFSAESRREIKAAFRLLFRSGLNTAQALERAATIEWQEAGRQFFEFVATAKRRGICRLDERALVAHQAGPGEA